MCDHPEVYLEKRRRGSGHDAPVLYLGLSRQVVDVFYGKLELLVDQEGGHVGRVEGHDDQREEPPGDGHQSRGGRPVGFGGWSEEPGLEMKE